MGMLQLAAAGVMVSSEDQPPCIHPKKRATDGKGSHIAPGFGDGHEISMGKLTTYKSWDDPPSTESESLKHFLGGGFKYFLFFTPTWGRFPI